jgi:hypothetical protein
VTRRSASTREPARGVPYSLGEVRTVIKSQVMDQYHREIMQWLVDLAEACAKADPDSPKDGERWCGRNATGGVETRTVVDRTLGRDVVYIAGKVRRRAWDGMDNKQCTPAEWHAWAMSAVRIDE